jgi:hypothetical protein
VFPADWYIWCAMPRQLLSGDLTPGEAAFVRDLGMALAGQAGAADAIAAQAVADVERAREAEFRNQPVLLQNTGGGRAAIVPNPL